MGLLPRCELTLPGQLTRAPPFSQNATVLTRRRKEAPKKPLCFHQSVRNPSSLQCFFSCEPNKNLKKKTVKLLFPSLLQFRGTTLKNKNNVIN